MGLIASRTVEESYLALKERSRRFDEYLLRRITDFQSNPASYGSLIGVGGQLRNASVQLGEFVLVPGLADYAKEIEGDPLYDVELEIANVQSVITDAEDWLRTNLPKDPATGYLDREKLNEDWSTQERYFTVTQMMPLVAHLQAIENVVI